MLPLRDINPSRTSPIVTVALIAINLLVFFGFQSRQSSDGQEELLYRRAAIACEVTTGFPLGAEEIVTDSCRPGADQPIFPEKNVYLALFTSMFLHGGVGHVLGNMWFLWIFGNNVEDAYGHGWYLLMYLIGGLIATLGFIVLRPRATVPLVGASGAISAVLGAYAILFPNARVLSLLGWIILPIPAWVYLVIWFGLQFFTADTGVAWEAHVGGFVFGAGLTLLLRGLLLRRSGSAFRPV